MRVVVVVEEVEREEEAVGEELIGGVKGGLRDGQRVATESPELELGQVGVAAATKLSEAAAVRQSQSVRWRW